jgi:hypothetical protein
VLRVPGVLPALELVLHLVSGLGCAPSRILSWGVVRLGHSCLRARPDPRSKSHSSFLTASKCAGHGRGSAGTSRVVDRAATLLANVGRTVRKRLLNLHLGVAAGCPASTRWTRGDRGGSIDHRTDREIIPEPCRASRREGHGDPDGQGGRQAHSADRRRI